MENIKRIEPIIVNDRRITGFYTHYIDSSFTHSCATFNSTNLTFHAADGYIKSVQIDKKIEALDIYHKQYGIALSVKHNCFFISSWLKGIYCCDLDTGKIKWNYRLKHAERIALFDDYLVGSFQDIGLRKLSYDGVEIAKYPMTTCSLEFYRLDEPFVFCGPRREKYFIIDTRTMDIIAKISKDTITPFSESLIVVNVEGTHEEFTISGFENDQCFQRYIKVCDK